MIFLYLVEELVVALFLLVMVTQVFWPIVTDRPLFPIFNKYRQTRADLATVVEDEELAIFANELAKRKAHIAELRKSNAPDPNIVQEDK